MSIFKRVVTANPLYLIDVTNAQGNFIHTIVCRGEEEAKKELVNLMLDQHHYVEHITLHEFDKQPCTVYQSFLNGKIFLQEDRPELTMQNPIKPNMNYEVLEK